MLRAAAIPTRMNPPAPSELTDLERLAAAGDAHVEARRIGAVACRGDRIPLYAFCLGSKDPAAPAIGFFGGVHGLERIGSEVVSSYLHSMIRRLRWDRVLQMQLEHVRLVFMPLVNPGGLLLRTRANPRGVDLMRNAPLDALVKPPAMIGGHRLSPRLPWYRGAAGAPMEDESAALCALVEDELLCRPFSMAVDCHSGFGLDDRIWFPFAYSPEPMPHLAEMHALLEILDQSHSHHRYVFEPQSRQYLAHGDLWDFLYLRSIEHARGLFLPLTLEMGSWLWVKKNPRQLFSRHGIFNPLIEHRRQRVLRRHLAWLDFMTRAALSHRHWRPDGAERESRHRAALRRWFEDRRK